MPLVNFQPRFVDAILDGTKVTTIRALRKRPFRDDDRLYLYTGARTRSCRKLGEAIAAAVLPILIGSATAPGIRFGRGTPLLMPESLDRVARWDGFSGWDELRGWIDRTHGPGPFRGQWITWVGTFEQATK